MENQISRMGNQALASEVFERMKPELTAMKKEELLVVNMDIAACISTVLGVLPAIKELRPQMVKELPAFDLVQFDKLEDYVLALSCAQADYTKATQPPDDLEVVNADAVRLRETLLAEARTLVHRGVVSEAQLLQLKGANGYKNIAADLLTLARVLQSVWSQIQGKVLTTDLDLDTAERLSTALSRVVGLREQAPARIAAATDMRLRAYSRLLMAYDDTRRAVTFLRGRLDDADDIAPGLHPGRPRKRVTEAEPEAPTHANTAPSVITPTATPVTAPDAAAHASPTEPFLQ